MKWLMTIEYSIVNRHFRGYSERDASKTDYCHLPEGDMAAYGKSFGLNP
jgi:hypothetical protein